MSKTNGVRNQSQPGALNAEGGQANAPAAAVMEFLQRHGLTPDALTARLATDASGRRINTAVSMGQSARSAVSMNDAGLLPELLGRLQRAVTAPPSYRWQAWVGQQEATLKSEAAQAVIETALALRAAPHVRPGQWLAHLTQVCDGALRTLDKQRQDALTALHQVEDELKQAQAQIDKLLRQSSNTGLLSRVTDVATSLLRWVDKGVNVAALTVSTERLLNERETQVFTSDVAAAAMRVLQTTRAQAQTEREQVQRFLGTLQHARQLLERDLTTAQERLVPNPYADVDLTSPAMKARLSQTELTLRGLPGSNLGPLMAAYSAVPHAAVALAAEVKQGPLKVAQERLSTLSLIEMMEIEARMFSSGDAGEPDKTNSSEGSADDLVIETLALVYERANQPSVQLDRRAQTISTRFVGVLDESNPGFGFSGANLVSTGRRDQLQFVRVQTGITLRDLVLYNEMGEDFEQAMRQRNYFVLSELAVNAGPRRTFALGLACGFITAKNGAFVAAHLGEAVRLGETLDAAMTQLALRTDVMDSIDTQMHAMPLDVLMPRLNAYLKRGIAEQDDLGRELADYVRVRLEAAREQHRYTADIAVAPVANGVTITSVNAVIKEEATWPK